MGTADGSRIRDLLIRRGWKTMPRADGSATGGWPAEEEDRDGQDGGGSCCCCCDRRRTTSGLADGGPRTRDGRPGKADPPAGKRIHRRRRATRGRAAAAAAVMTLREGVKNGFGARGLPPPGARRAPRGSAAAMRRVVAGSHLSSVTMSQMEACCIDRGPKGNIYRVHETPQTLEYVKRLNYP